jgi:hypothetical protein
MSQDVVGIAFLIVVVLLLVALFVAWLFSLLEVIFLRSDLSGSERVAWTLVLLFGHLLGLIAWIIFYPRKRGGSFLDRVRQADQPGFRPRTG